jgi:hypothetical protein
MKIEKFRENEEMIVKSYDAFESLPINPSMLAQFPGRDPHLHQVNFTVPW